jgi:GNAT superfamily N-acetyltransferase
MTADAQLMRLELGNQIVGAHAFLVPSPEVKRRYDTSVDTVAGLTVETCAAWDYPLFNRVIGAGVLGGLDARGLDAIVAHFAARRRQPCVEVYAEITPRPVLDALASAGFTDSGHGLESHVLETDRPMNVTVPGVAVRRVAEREYRRFGELVRDGFGMAGEADLGPFFVDLTEASLRATGADGAAFIASVDGADAGTGQLLLSDRVAGCYSGSVLDAFRGRGIQKTLIAARIAEGLKRGRTIFISQTDPDSPSGRNLHDVGFRTLYRAAWYTRPA